MNRRKFIKLLGLTAVVVTLPIAFRKDTKFVMPKFVEPTHTADGQLIGYEPEPLYANVKVNMDYDFNDIFIADANTGEQIIIPSSEPLPFSYEYKRS